MTTPDRRSSGTSLQRLAPSGSFLQQLLEEISGAGPSDALRERRTPHSSPTTQPTESGSRRTSSVWVGGTSIAQDAREKLRAADEARLYKPFISGHDGAPDTPRPRLQLRIPRYNPPAQSQIHSTAPTSGDPYSSPQVRVEPTTHETGPTISHDAEAPRPRHRPSAGLLRPPVSATNDTRPSMGYNEATGLASPLIICDADSDTSNTPSPLEEPSSATSDTLTDATTMSHERRTSHSRESAQSEWLIAIDADCSRKTDPQRVILPRAAVQEDSYDDAARHPRWYPVPGGHGAPSLEKQCRRRQSLHRSRLHLHRTRSSSPGAFGLQPSQPHARALLLPTSSR
jgi:hypothetical protein